MTPRPRDKCGVHRKEEDQEEEKRMHAGARANFSGWPAGKRVRSRVKTCGGVMIGRDDGPAKHALRYPETVGW